MTIAPNMIELLRCPETGSSLQPLEQPQVDQLNETIRQKKLVNRMGKTVQNELDGALINESQTWIYMVRSGIVSLICDESIASGSLQAPKI